MYPWNHPAISTDTKLGQDLREQSREFWEPCTDDEGEVTWHPIKTGKEGS